MKRKRLQFLLKRGKESLAMELFNTQRELIPCFYVFSDFSRCSTAIRPWQYFDNDNNDEKKMIVEKKIKNENNNNNNNL